MSNLFFFFNATTTTEIYTLSLHDALPISERERIIAAAKAEAQQEYATAREQLRNQVADLAVAGAAKILQRSEEHTSELQSRRDLVCRLLLEKKKKNKNENNTHTQHHNSTI